ncbi:MAG: hypothetical protein BVN32_08795 [Proteobacteria bacterium ST_bin14]|nr:MAG: hypothetical protein BVN32_08795 [Proteobacteria bacterium ST_bin14]
MNDLSNQPLGLRFESIDDTLNHARDLVESSNSFVVNQSAIGKGDIAFDDGFKFRIRTGFSKFYEYDFIFRNPFLKERKVAVAYSINADISGVQSRFEMNSVLIVIRYFKKRSQEIVSLSFLFVSPKGLERLQCDVQLFGDARIQVFTLRGAQSSLQVSKVCTAGEIRFIRIDAPYRNSGGMSGHIQGVPEVIKDSVCMTPDVLCWLGQYFKDTDLFESTGAHSITDSVWVAIEESSASFLEIVDVSICPPPSRFSIIESF